MIKWVLILFLSSCTVLKRAEAPKEVIRLDGSKSYDPDGQILSYFWKQVSGLPVQIENPKGVMTYGNFKGRGVYKFELTVIDNNGAMDKDTAIVIKY